MALGSYGATGFLFGGSGELGAGVVITTGSARKRTFSDVSDVGVTVAEKPIFVEFPGVFGKVAGIARKA